MKVRRTDFELYNKDGDPIRGDVWGGAEARGKAAIVICHGFKGFKNWGFFPYTAERLVEGAGYPVVQFNFSGCGIGPDLENFTELDKFERNTFSKELDDLKVVLDAAEAGELPGLLPRGRFGLLGHSRGGISTIVAAGEDPRVVALVTWNAIARVDRWSEGQKEEWRRTGRMEILNTRTGQIMPVGVGLLEDAERNAERFDLERAAARLEVPYLIVHGEDDESVSIADGERLAAAAPAEITRFERIKGGSHTFGAVHPFAGTTEQLDRAVDLSVGWFAVYLEE
jgi:pimeloyl-ACP methyl ester carboxylesterase